MKSMMVNVPLTTWEMRIIPTDYSFVGHRRVPDIWFLVHPLTPCQIRGELSAESITAHETVFRVAGRPIGPCATDPLGPSKAHGGVLERCLPPIPATRDRYL